MEKHAFLNYLKEKKRQKQLEEDAVLAANASSTNLDSDVISISSSSNHVTDIVSSPSSSNIGLTDHSVLGTIERSKKNKKDNGFFGKDDFFLPQNVLSGEVEKRYNIKH